jgi:hypothetical protein
MRLDWGKSQFVFLIRKIKSKSRKRVGGSEGEGSLGWLTEFWITLTCFRSSRMGLGKTGSTGDVVVRWVELI